MQIGIDLVEIKRIKKLNSKRFRKHILSLQEEEIYHSISLKAKKNEYLASRFAGKEAVAKAINNSDKKINFKDIIILNKENGAPYVIFKKDENLSFSISITHTKKYAAAFVILNKDNL